MVARRSLARRTPAAPLTTPPQLPRKPASVLRIRPERLGARAEIHLPARAPRRDDSNFRTAPVASTDSVSAFDPLGRKVEFGNGSTHTQVVYGPGGGKLALMNDQTLVKARVPLPSGGAATYTSSGLAFYSHVDWLGSARFFSILAAVLCVFARAHAQSATPSTSTLRLENYGWQILPPGEYYEHLGAHSRNLWIDHSGRVLVGFTVRENSGLATRQHPGHSLHILRFTPEGKMDLSLVLPTNNWYNNGFYLGPDDQILARANDLLQWFLPDDLEKGGGTWQPLAACPRDCFVRQSFSRRTLILRVEPPTGGPDRSTYTILDTSSTPRVVRTCSQMAFYGGHITDRFAYWMNYDRDDGLMVRFPFCDLDHYEDFPRLVRGTSGYVLDDATLLKIGFTHDGPVYLELLGLDGQVRFSRRMPKHEFINPYDIATDRNHDRFAIMVNTVRGAHSRLDIGGNLVARRVVVYSEAGEEVASIPVDTRYHRDSDFSMSPDGHRLAILDEGVVTVVNLEQH